MWAKINMQALKVVNWDKWQSYRSDRGQPPWIKVHRALLRNDEFMELNDQERGQLLCLWILAADNGGVIMTSNRRHTDVTHVAQQIKKKCFLTGNLNINKFIDLDFIEWDGVNMTSERRQDDVNMTPQSREVQNREEYICSSDDEREDQFDQFWNVCLRKVGKKKAQQKWKTLQCNKKADDIIAAMKNQNTHMFQFRDITKVPHPATWLHGECWNDHVVSEKPKPKQTHSNGFDQPPPRAQPPAASSLQREHTRPLTDTEKENFKKLVKQAKAKINPNAETPKLKPQADEKQTTDRRATMAQLLGAAKTCFAGFDAQQKDCGTKWQIWTSGENHKCHWCAKFEKQRNAAPTDGKSAQGIGDVLGQTKSRIET